MMQDMHSQLAGDDLVHTSYLLARPVRDLLCLHIRNSQNHPSGQESLLPAETLASIHADGQSARRGLRAAGWLLLAAVFVVLIIVETLNGEFFFVLPAALILTGAAVATTPFRIPCQTAGKCAFRTALAAGSALILSGLCFGIAPHLFPGGMGLVPLPNPAFLAAFLLLSAAICFVVSLTNARRSPLWASLAGWLGLVILLVLASLSNSLLQNETLNVSGLLLVLLAVLFGLYQAFSPLKSACDVFCMPSPASSRSQLVPRSESLPTDAVDDWVVEFRNQMRHRLSDDKSAPSYLADWLDRFHRSLQKRLAEDAELASYALPRLGDPNRLALLVLLLLVGGIIAGLLVPFLLLTIGVQQRPALLGGIAISGWFAVLLSILLSFGSAVRASRGAQRGWMARLSIEFFSFSFLFGIAVLFGLSVHQEFFRIPDRQPRENAVWLSNAPLLVSVDQGSMALLNSATGLQGGFMDAEGIPDWDFVESGRSAPGQSQFAGVRGNLFRVWDSFDSGRWRTRDFGGYGNLIAALAFSEHDDVWVSLSTHSNVTVWDARRGRETGHLPHFKTPISSLAVSPSKPQVVLGLRDRSLRLWDWQKRQQLATIENLPGIIRQMTYVSEATGVFALDDRGILHRFRIGDAQPLLVPADLPPWCPSPKADALGKAAQNALESGGPSQVENFAVFQPGSGKPQLALSCKDQRRHHVLLGGTLDEKKDAYRLENFPGKAASLSFSPDGATLAAKMAESTPMMICIIDVPSGRIRGVWEHAFKLSAATFSPDGQSIVTGSWGTVAIWSAQTGESQAALSGHEGTVSCVAFSPDGKTLASGSYDNTVKLWDTGTWEERATLRGHSDWVTGVAFSPDGKTLASASHDKTVKLWDLGSTRERITLRGHADWVNDIAFSPNRKRLASASRDGTVKLWDLASGTDNDTLRGHRGGVSSVAFSPDGKTIASASEDDTLKLWDVATGTERATLHGHSGGVNQLVYSPDGRILASASSDATLRLWDISTRTATATLRGHSSALSHVAFSPDGTTLVTAGEDDTVKLWDATRRCALRSLSPWIFRPAP